MIFFFLLPLPDNLTESKQDRERRRKLQRNKTSGRSDVFLSATTRQLNSTTLPASEEGSEQCDPFFITIIRQHNGLYEREEAVKEITAQQD